MEFLDLAGIWATKHDGVWIAGRRGVVRHWNGASWSRHQPDSDFTFTGIWAPAPNDVWAAGYKRFPRGPHAAL
jgi:hypothetical protein